MITVRRWCTIKTSPPCPSCKAVTEEWWSYCAMCGWHIASGTSPPEPDLSVRTDIEDRVRLVNFAGHAAEFILLRRPWTS